MPHHPDNLRIEAAVTRNTARHRANRRGEVADVFFVFFRQPVRIKYAVFVGGLVFIQGLGEVDGGGFAAR